MDMIQSINLIAINPKVRSGRAVVAGTTVTVSDIVMIKRFQVDDVDELAAWFGLAPEQIYAALSYYYLHKSAMDTEIRQQLAIAKQLEERHYSSEEHRAEATLSKKLI